jgi:poly(A) polymerase/tRNA nucleotidyltransferase (CCA-adding enzyme)
VKRLAGRLRIVAEAPRISLDAFTPAAREALQALDAALGPRGRAWVVGGAVRDALLARAADDLDVAVPAGAVGLGRALADRLGAAFVLLDEGRGVCRVVGAVHVDLADFRGPDLAADLRGRDFTVNALAAPVHDLVVRGDAALEDATGGVSDLAHRRVRLCAPGSLRDDPVRVLRAARLAIEPGWTLAPDVEPAAREAAAAVAGASAERVRDELIALLSGPSAGAGLRLLDRLGVVDVVLPESLAMRRTPQPLPHRFDVWEHSLRAVEAADAIAGGIERLEPWAAEVREHLAEELGDGLDRAAALKLAALLHDVAKPDTRAVVDGRIRFIGHDRLGAERARAIATRWRLSGRARDVLARLVDQHLRPMHLAQAGEITRRARYRFFRDLGNDARDLLLLSLADASAVRGDSPFHVWAGPAGDVLRTLMAGMVEEARATASAPLLGGDDVMQALGIGPGPAVGRLLGEVREAQAEGLIRTRDEALDHLRRTAARWLDTPDGGP